MNTFNVVVLREGDEVSGYYIGSRLRMQGTVAVYFHELLNAAGRVHVMAAEDDLPLRFLTCIPKGTLTRVTRLRAEFACEIEEPYYVEMDKDARIDPLTGRYLGDIYPSPRPQRSKSACSAKCS